LRLIGLLRDGDEEWAGVECTEDLGIAGERGIGIENDAEESTGTGGTGGEEGVIGADGADADEDGIHTTSEGVDKFAGFFVGDPV